MGTHNSYLTGELPSFFDKPGYILIRVLFRVAAETRVKLQNDRTILGINLAAADTWRDFPMRHLSYVSIIMLYLCAASWDFTGQ